MAEQRVWVVHVETWALQLMWRVDAQDAVRLGEYALAPVGGYAPPVPTSIPVERPRREVA